jgi:hypothetical protein
MNSQNPQFTLFPLKFYFLPCPASLVLSMCDSNVMHRVAILMSHNTVEFGTSERFEDSSLLGCAAVSLVE